MKVTMRTVILLVFAITLVFSQTIYKNDGDARLAPRVINYQSYLTDTQDNPITNQSISMTFVIFDNSSGGSQKWTETQSAVSVDKGIFNVLLGSVTPIPDSVFKNSANRWLELTVGGQTLTPRTQIVSSAYAYTSTYSDTALYSHNAAPDNDWSFLVSDVADTTLQMGGRWGLARAGNVMYGNADSTHVNLGVACTTGTLGQNFKYCAIGGGYINKARFGYTAVAGGYGNTANASYATVCGGSRNTASGLYSVVGGGYADTTVGSYATVAGGYSNRVDSSFAFIGGGYNNTATGNYATVGGGSSNIASGGNATVAGGNTNMAESLFATVGGGRYNAACNRFATVAGGFTDTASGWGTTVGGGNYNVASDECATVAGGLYNIASGTYATVAGGLSKFIISLWQFHSRQQCDGSCWLHQFCSTKRSDRDRIRSDAGWCTL